MGANTARMFGEMPTLTYNGALAAQTLAENGVATIMVLTDTVFAALTFRWPISTTASVSLAGTTIPAGSILYGVATYQVTSGAGIAYHSTV